MVKSDKVDREKAFRRFDPIEVTGEHLAEIINSPPFSKNLKKAWNIACETGHESGFCIARSVQSDTIIYGRVVGAEKAQDAELVPIESFTSAMWGLEEASLGSWYQEQYPVLVLVVHTHPSASIHPSQADFVSLVGSREAAEVNHYPIMAIASNPYYSSRQLDILMVQEKTTTAPRSSIAAAAAFDWFVNSLAKGSEDDHAAIVRTLDLSPVVKAELISFRRSLTTGTLRPLFSPDDLKAKLARFSYQIQSV